MKIALLVALAATTVIATAAFVRPSSEGRLVSTIGSSHPVTVRADDVALGDLGSDRLLGDSTGRKTDRKQLQLARPVIEIHTDRGEAPAAVRARPRLRVSEDLPDASAASTFRDDTSRSVARLPRAIPTAFRVRVPKRHSRELRSAVRTAKCVRETPGLRRAIVARRLATWAHEDFLGYPRTRSAGRERTAIGCAYLRWIRGHWAGLADSMWREIVDLRDPRNAICHVFGNYCSQAIGVARCESHLTTTAANGQYLGLFQMGSSERRLYGHSSTALGQSTSAYRYFVASGRDWSPWSCRWAAD